MVEKKKTKGADHCLKDQDFELIGSFFLFS